MYDTHGRWTVRTGREEEFVALWRAFAEWAITNLPDAKGAVVSRDRDHPNQFVSFGPWPTLEAIDDFRSRPEFAAALAGMRPLLEGVETATLEAVAVVGEPG